MIKNITHSTERELQLAVNTLNDAIGCPSWYMFEMTKYWNLVKEEITTIHLINTGDGNKYRIYHSELTHIEDSDDIVACLMELAKECLAEELRNLNEVVSEVLRL